jgi:PBSX family phage portal protein
MAQDEAELADVAKRFDDVLPEVRARFIEVNEPVRKGTIGEPDRGTQTNQVIGDDYATAFTTLGALDPVYDPEMLALLFEHSNSLRQNVDSMAVNVDGFGHRFDPLFDLEAKDIDQRIADAMLTDRQRALDETGRSLEAKLPTPDEVKTRKAEIAVEMRIEKIRLTHFFEFCSPDTSFVTLRRRTRQDLEVTGNAYWEVLRNRAGQVVQFVYMPSFTVRLLPLDLEPVALSSRVRVSELSFDEVEYTTRLRRYLQIVETRFSFFKELGDPRVISAQSGMIYPSVEVLAKAEPNARPANELVHFKIHSPRSPYGVPRWIGNLLAVVGSRQAEEVNFNYFENKSVPPLAILVSGGRMSQGSVDRVTNYIEANIKGKKNFHKILVLEAEAAGSGERDANASRMRIDIKPLTGAQHSDALFQNYDERNIDKVGQSFRLPRMLRGDIRDFNRSTADAALTFAEMQVFEPERQEFDFIVNRRVLSMLGVRFWRFVSLAPVMRDPTAMSEIIKNLMNASVLTPEEARELAGDVFNREFRRIRAPWVTQPPAFTIAGIVPEPEGTTPDAPREADNFGPEGGEDAPAKAPAEGIEARMTERLRGAAVDQAKKLIAIRKALRLVEHEAWFEQFRAKANGAAAPP